WRRGPPPRPPRPIEPLPPRGSPPRAPSRCGSAIGRPPCTGSPWPRAAWRPAPSPSRPRWRGWGRGLRGDTRSQPRPSSSSSPRLEKAVGPRPTRAAAHFRRFAHYGSDNAYRGRNFPCGGGGCDHGRIPQDGCQASIHGHVRARFGSRQGAGRLRPPTARAGKNGDRFVVFGEGPKSEARTRMSDEVKKIPAPEGAHKAAEIPQVLPILPLRNSVFFPGGVLPLAVGRQKTIALIKDAVRDEQLIGVVTQRRAEDEDPDAEGLHEVGTVARIVKLLKMGEDNYSLVVQGITRFRVVEIVQDTPYLKARGEIVTEERPTDDVEIEALAINLKQLAREVIEQMPELPAAATELVESITHPGHLADLIAANIDVSLEEKQRVLETIELRDRMKLVLELLNRKREILKLSSKIDSQVKGEMSKTQREYYLRQQLKAIKEELGEL